jgi:hypothetical protein
MTAAVFLRRAGRWTAAGVLMTAATYGAAAGVAWLRYGRPAPPDPLAGDPLLDAFMPGYDIVERHAIHVAAPADVTFAAAGDLDLMDAPVIATIFKARELVLGADADPRNRPRGLIALTQSLGWGVLAKVPGREIVMGAVTKPWEPNVTFRALAPADFARFDEPGYVKLAWTLRADRLFANRSEFRTETRAIATDAVARSRFRRYCSFASPGIALIRRLTLSAVRSDAEARYAIAYSRERRQA